MIGTIIFLAQYVTFRVWPDRPFLVHALTSQARVVLSKFEKIDKN